MQPLGTAAPGEQLGTVSLRWAERAGGPATQLDAAISWPDTEASPTLRLAALVADTAELLKGTSTVGERGFTLPDLQAEADELARLEFDGAGEALAFLEAAQDGQALPVEE